MSSRRFEVLTICTTPVPLREAELDALQAVYDEIADARYEQALADAAATVISTVTDPSANVTQPVIPEL